MLQLADGRFLQFRHFDINVIQTLTDGVRAIGVFRIHLTGKVPELGFSNSHIPSFSVGRRTWKQWYKTL